VRVAQNTWIDSVSVGEYYNKWPHNNLCMYFKRLTDKTTEWTKLPYLFWCLSFQRNFSDKRQYTTLLGSSELQPYKWLNGWFHCSPWSDQTWDWLKKRISILRKAKLNCPYKCREGIQGKRDTVPFIRNLDTRRGGGGSEVMFTPPAELNTNIRRRNT
jgi:hypothetical protein